MVYRLNSNSDQIDIHYWQNIVVYMVAGISITVFIICSIEVQEEIVECFYLNFYLNHESI